MCFIITSIEIHRCWPVQPVSLPLMMCGLCHVVTTPQPTHSTNLSLYYYFSAVNISHASPHP